MNQGKYGFKQSKLYKGINALMLFNTILILVLAGIFSTANYFFVTDNLDKALYLFKDAKSPGDQAARSFFSFFLLFN